LEREKKMAQEGTIGIGGIRTFLFFSLTGALSAWLSRQTGNSWIFVSGFMVVSMFALTGYFIQARHKPENVGLTTAMAGIIVFMLGGSVMFGHRDVSVMLAIVTSAVLAFKKPIHGVIHRFGDDDIRAGLKLLIATFVVLPLLPDYPVDPWRALNPYKLWMLVILISSLSLIGYVAVRWLGTRRGVALTAFSGGLISSTAVTLSFSRRSIDESVASGKALSAGIVLAWAVMFIRVITEVLIVYPQIVQELWVPYLVMIVIALSVSAFFFFQSAGPSESGGKDIAFRNPFNLISASKFALLFAFILLMVKLVELHSTGAGFYIVAALAGTTDVDAITLSMADYAKQGGDSRTAVAAITIASLSNTLVKCFICAILGSSILRKRIIIAAIAISAGGLISLLL